MSTRYTYYHHPYCTKAAQAKKYLETVCDVETIDYTVSIPSVGQLRAVAEMMDAENIREMVRENTLTKAEKEIVANGTIDERLEILVRDIPELLQRPILVDHKLGIAVVGRPFSRIEELLKPLLPLVKTVCPKLKLIARGKVRDIYDIDSNSLLFVATDRISAYDVVMKDGIPNKGKILTQLSEFWFNLLQDVLPNHLITSDIHRMPPIVQQYREQLEGRSMLVKKLEILPVEAIVRGYITGSAMNEYVTKGTVCDMPLPAGLAESQALKTPLFTPSTKAEIGGHGKCFFT